MGVLSIELYLANKHGKTVDEIARVLQLPQAEVSERIEAARLFVTYQLPLMATK